jgi:hypothetical protein
MLTDTNAHAYIRVTHHTRAWQYGVALAELEDTLGDNTTVQPETQGEDRLEFLNTPTISGNRRDAWSLGSDLWGLSPHCTCQTGRLTMTRESIRTHTGFSPQLPIIIEEPRHERHRPDAVGSGAIASHEVKAAALMKMDRGPNLFFCWLGVEHPTRTP